MRGKQGGRQLGVEHKGRKREEEWVKEEGQKEEGRSVKRGRREMEASVKREIIDRNVRRKGKEGTRVKENGKISGTFLGIINAHLNNR